jgi:hypothetical protein
MYKILRKKSALFVIGLCIGTLIVGSFVYREAITHVFFPHKNTEVHVHGDFALYVLDTKIDLTADKYQSTPESVKHPDMHFHDNVDTVIHRHADGVTLAAFMSSLGFTLTDSCITLDTGVSHCSDEKNTLLLFIDGKAETDIANYITTEEDRILLYYGDPNASIITTYQNEITEQSCMYSGTCPEKGTPPSESCGLTCEI